MKLLDRKNKILSFCLWVLCLLNSIFFLFCILCQFYNIFSIVFWFMCWYFQDTSCWMLHTFYGIIQIMWRANFINVQFLSVSNCSWGIQSSQNASAISWLISLFGLFKAASSLHNIENYAGHVFWILNLLYSYGGFHLLPCIAIYVFHQFHWK